MDGSSPLVRALLHPFERGPLDWPGRAFMLRALADPALLAWRDGLICRQSFKPAHDRLVAAGFTVAADPLLPPAAGFPLGLVLLSRHKDEARAQVAEGLAALAPDGLLVAAGANGAGAASVQKEAAQSLGLAGALSKHQCRVFWLRPPRDPAALAVLARWRAGGLARPVPGTAGMARAGCFSPDHVDAGSALLAAHLPADLAGMGADLGAGWGFLAAGVLERCPAVTHLDLYEAEALALADARANLAAYGARVSAVWHDVRTGLPGGRRYDFIITNPPFHDGALADPAIGRDFISAAAAGLTAAGRLFLVANRHLPYEAHLRQLFGRVDSLADADGFKVLAASGRHALQPASGRHTLQPAGGRPRSSR